MTAADTRAEPSDPVRCVVVVPVHNAAATLERCLSSALRQEEIDKRIIVVDHESTDGSVGLVARLAGRFPEIELIRLTRGPHDRKSPSRPLNAAMDAVLRHADPSRERSWVVRLDADDVLTGDRVIADQLRAGRYRRMVMATLVFFDEARRTAYEYGPRLGHRDLRTLPGRDLYAVAHHATMVRMDLLERALAAGRLYDEHLETGEDLGATCRLVRSLDGDASQFAFVPAPYCYKALADTTITGSLPLRRAAAAHVRLLRDNPEITRFAIVRGLAELSLGRLVGESAARRSLQRLAGRNGHYEAVPFDDVAARLANLAADTPVDAAGRDGTGTT